RSPLAGHCPFACVETRSTHVGVVTSPRVSRKSERPIDGFGEQPPTALLCLELAPACRGDGVETRFAAGVGGAPLGPQPLVGGHTLQGWIERALLDSQRIVRRLVNALRNRVAVLRAPSCQRLEDQQVERALQAVVRMFRHRQLYVAGYASSFGQA